MLKIYKYAISPKDLVTIEMPAGAKILDVQVQNNYPQIWVLVDPEQPMEKRYFRPVATGQAITESRNELLYIGTFQLYHIFPEGLVFHLFELPFGIGENI